MIQRNYDLYLEKKQFAAITGNFLAWEFELKDGNGGTLGLIDRNFQVCSVVTILALGLQYCCCSV